MHEWLTDLRYGARMILKRPGTSAIAIVALALGIGLTTVMFSIVQGVLLRGLPFPESDRIMAVVRASVQEPVQRQPTAMHDLADFRERQTTLESLAAFGGRSATITGDGDFPERLRGSRVTPNLFSVLRVAPIAGRDFIEADAAPGAPPVTIISHRLWTSRFEGSQAAIGSTVRIDGVPTTIVGVMPEKFGFPEAEQIWFPHDVTPAVKRGEGTRLNVIGRLKPGVSAEQAHAEFSGIARQLAEAHPENKDVIARVNPYIEEFIPSQIRETFYTMLGAVLGVMLIACVNVTNLQLARAAERAKEFAIRTALGSGRWRVVRQSLAEGLVLATAGAALGLGIAQYGTGFFMQAIADTQPPFWIDVRLDPVVLAFVTLITVLAAIVSSVAPGLRVSRADTHGVLKDDSRGTTSLRMGRFSRWLVVVEVTVSCVLLVVSGLMIRSIMATSRLDYGFNTTSVFFGQVSFDQRQVPETADLQRLLEPLEQRLARVPGVSRVALATAVPGQGSTPLLAIEGETYASPEAQPRAMQILATTGYFDVLGVPLRQGRLFTTGDTAGAEPVAVVDEAFVARHFTNGPAIGRRIRLGDDKQPWLTIVGVVPSLVPTSQSGQAIESVYRPLPQAPQRFMTVLALTPGDPLTLTSGIRTAVAELHDQTPVTNANSLAGEFWRRGWAFRLFGGLFLTFGAAALLLAAAGLYGVMSFTVRRRTQEIGVRMALGANRRGVLGMVLWQGLWRVALGVVLGLVPGWFVGTLMQALLTGGVSATDPVVHGTTAATLLAAGLLACLGPALRASSVDPLTALRRD